MGGWHCLGNGLQKEVCHMRSTHSLAIKRMHEEDREHPDSGIVGRKLIYVSVRVFLVAKQDAVSRWGLMSAEISWLFLFLQPSMLLVFAAVSFLRSSWPVVPTAVHAPEEWQSCWDTGLCLFFLSFSDFLTMEALLRSCTMLCCPWDGMQSKE